jgi:hypothetical protein
MTNGFVAFVRKLANKIIEIGRKTDDINNILDSIPEWNEFIESDLNRANDIENRPLASDPRNKTQPASGEDDMDFFFKIKSNFNSNKAEVKQNESQQEEDD